MLDNDNVMVSMIVPTYNEATNICTLIEQIHNALDGISYEVIVVDDDSPDGTGDQAEHMAGDYCVRVIRRAGKKGLASAVIDGFAVARGDVLGCIDADLSHPPELIPKLLKTIRDDGAGVVFASRLVPGGGAVGEWPQRRRLNSYVAGFMARPLTKVKDAMSGYFLFRKEVIDGVRLVPRGYKIGLEILVKGRYDKVLEVPFVFDNRHSGKSKLSPRVQIAYLIQLVHLYAFQVGQMFKGGKRRK